MPATNTTTALATIDPLAMSYYLALRHLPFPGLEWVPQVAPTLPTPNLARYQVTTTDEVIDALAWTTEAVAALDGPMGLLLSGGIDSAVLAAFMPPDTPCFTVVFDAPGAADESAAAAEVAAHWGLPHSIIHVSFADYEAHADHLMANKAAPLHPAEVPLYLVAHHARLQGISALAVGSGADSVFGGLHHLLARDWTFEHFVDRYTFADPESILAMPADTSPAFEAYRRGDGIDVEAFLAERHGQGTVQAVENAIGAAGVRACIPYGLLELAAPLDLDRIRAGESKYLLADAYRLLYDTDEVPTKVPFARPVGTWLRGWEGPAARPEFRDDLPHRVGDLSGEALWLTWCLDRFCSLLDIVTAR